MGSLKVASSALFAYCACLACGGNAAQDGASNADASAGTAGTAGVLPAAGNTSSGGSHSPPTYAGRGTLTAAWSSFCVATFTVDYAATDGFDKPLFTARAGEKYLLVSLPSASPANLAYLTPYGPIEFEVGVNVDGSRPFTSNCTPALTPTYYAVFADVSVYAEPELDTKLCDLTDGTSAPYDDSKIAGYNLITNAGLVAIYEIKLNAFSARCGAADKGYIRVPAISTLDATRLIVPFKVILGKP